MLKPTAADNLVVGKLQQVFYALGLLICKSPRLVILVSCFITLLSTVGFINFKLESSGVKLWLPESSSFRIQQNWEKERYPKTSRESIVMVKGENVLTPEGLRVMLEVHKVVEKISVDGKQFSDLCTKVNSADTSSFYSRSSNTYDDDIMYDEYADEAKIDNIDYSQYDIDYGNTDYDDDQQTFDSVDYELRNKNIELLDTDVYCDLFNSQEKKCLKNSLLEIWKFNEKKILSASQQEIIDAVNNLYFSPWYGVKYNFTNFIGGITRNKTGKSHIVSATTTEMIWSLEVPENSTLVESQGGGVEFTFADQTTLDWEDLFANTIRKLAKNESSFTFLQYTNKDLTDTFANNVFFDGVKLLIGYFLMFIYTMFMLGNGNNQIEIRFYLTLAGLTSIIMGCIFAVGICSAAGLPYTPLHVVFSFLCLGIGIDDMFVIMKYFELIKKDTRYQTLSKEEKIAEALKHSGATLVITTVTDILVFCIGAFTQMHILFSFCLYCAVALLAVFAFQLTFFVACLYLDEARIMSKKHGIFPWLTVDDSKDQFCDFLTMPTVFSKLNLAIIPLESNIYKTAIIGLAFVSVCISSWGVYNVKVLHDMAIIAPEDSQVSLFTEQHQQTFQESSISWWTAYVYTEEIKFSDLHKIEEVVNGTKDSIRHGTTGLHSVDDWWTPFLQYIKDKHNLTTIVGLEEREIAQLLSDFLFHRTGFLYRDNFHWSSELLCNQPAPSILASRYQVIFNYNKDPYIRATTYIKLKKAISGSEVSSRIFMQFSFMTEIEINEIMNYELKRNIGITLGCIAAIVLMLFNSFTGCLMVITSVGLALINIIGYLQLSGINIDLVAAISIAVSLGFSVDYSVHIVHSYLVWPGSRLQKAKKSLDKVGPAVLNGGLSTFLAVIVLAGSKSPAFQTFFQINLFTVIFGLFHGVFLVTVLLSLVGPEKKKINLDSQNVYTVTKHNKSWTAPDADKTTRK